METLQKQPRCLEGVGWGLPGGPPPARSPRSPRMPTPPRATRRLHAAPRVTQPHAASAASTRVHVTLPSHLPDPSHLTPSGNSSKSTGRLLFLGLHLRHTEVPRLGVQAELQLPAYATAAATRDPSRVCDLHHSSRQCPIPNPLSKGRDPLSKGRDQTRNLMVPSRTH